MSIRRSSTTSAGCTTTTYGSTAGSGPRILVGLIASQLELLESLCGQARGSVRDELLATAGRFTELASWFHKDPGDITSAMHWTTRATEFAQELGDAHLTSYVLMRKSGIASDGGLTGQAIGLANAAIREWDHLTPGLRALALRQKAFAHAAVGERDECIRALDMAMIEVMTVDPEGESDLAGYCTQSFIEMEAANSRARLGEPASSIDTYTQSIARWPDSQQRDQCLCVARLANAYADLGEIELASGAGRQAAALVRQAPSARTLAALRKLSAHVAPMRKVAAVNELRDALAGIV